LKYKHSQAGRKRCNTITRGSIQRQEKEVRVRSRDIKAGKGKALQEQPGMHEWQPIASSVNAVLHSV